MRAQLRSAEASLPAALTEAVPALEFSTAMLQGMLGRGAEAVLPADEGRPVPRAQVAAILLLWARRCLRRQLARQALTEQFRRVSKTARRLKQMMAGRQLTAASAKPDDGLLAFCAAGGVPDLPPMAAGTPNGGFARDARYKLTGRFRARPVLWTRGPRAPRLFDAAFVPRAWGGTVWAVPGVCGIPGDADYEIPRSTALTHTAIVKAVLQQNAKTAQGYRAKPGEEDDGTPPRFGPPRLPPPPSLVAAARTGARNSAEQRTGLHPRVYGPDGLRFAEELRDQLRGIVLAMRADGDDAEEEEEVELGKCDLFEGMRWSAAAALGEPMQLAWGFAVAERLHFLWGKMELGADGKATGSSSADSAGRHGLPDLPNAWCPARPRAPARRPGRAHAREFLGLMLQQKRIHMNEVRSGYASCSSASARDADADASKSARESLLYQHAMAVLASLRRGPESHARWVTLIQSQLADESEDAVDAPAIANRLRVAASKITALEELLIEGLAEYSDARGALRLHVFNAYQTVSLQDQVQSRLSATPLGELIGQRLEQLELPDFSPKQLGCEGVPPFTRASAPSKVQTALLPYVMPASEAAAPMSLDNALLNTWMGLLPALLRTAAPVRMKGVIPVGDVDAYDAALDAIIRTTLGLKPPAPHGEDAPPEAAESTPEVVVPPGAPGSASFKPSTQSMLCLCAVARYAWAAARKGPDSQKKKVENDRLEKAAGADGKFLTKRQLQQVDQTLQIIMDRVRAATPKGAKPTDKATVEALRGESTALEADTLAIGLPTPDDVDVVRDTVSSLLDLIGGAARAITQRRPPAEGPEFAAKNIARSVRIMRDSLAEALSMSADIHVASKLDAEGLLAVVAEAVGDVAVEQSDLIRAVFKCLYQKTLDSLLGSAKIPKGPARVFLQKLVVRKPNVPAPRLNVMEFVAGKSRAMAIALREAALDPALDGSEKVAAKVAASFAEDVKGGEMERAVTWSTKVAEALQASIEGEQTMLKLITEMTLDDVRAVQGELSSPPPGGKKYLLSELVSNGVGGVAKQSMLRKLELATVYDSDTPIELNLAYRLLPGRGDNSEPHKYGLPLRYAEGEEVRHGAAVNQSINALLDAGQRLRPDGSEFNVIRLHRIWCMQSSAADAAATLTLEKMMDEHVTLTLRSCFFNQTAEDEVVIRGKREVMRYLTNDGFSTLGTTGTPEAPKAKGEGCTFVQPCSVTGEGDTRVVFGAGGKDACGSAKDRFRLGEQIKWGPWGVALAIVRVADPLPTHYEMIYRHHAGNFAAVKKSLDKGVVYYCLVHQRAPAHPQVPPFDAKVYLGQAAVFERLDNEMSRMGGKVAVIAPALMGEKLRDLQKRRENAALGSDDDEDGADSDDEGGGAARANAIARRAYAECVNWESGAPGDAGPDVSVVSFAGRWLPPGEGPKRRGELVITVRETIGWKYQSKPPAKGDPKPSASRSVGLLVREFFVDTALYEDPPLAPGLAAAWNLHEQRMGTFRS